MYVPIFRKTVTFTNLAGVAVTISSIVSFYKSGVNRLANRRCLYRSHDFGFTAKDSSQINLYYPAFVTSFMNGSILQTLCRNAERTFRAAAFTCGKRLDVSAISLQNSLFIRLILIRCYQIHNTSTSSVLKIGHEFINIFSCAFARYNADYQPMLRVVSNVIPVITLMPVSRVLLTTMFFLLAYKGPFLVKLRLIGFGGKKLPTHHEAIWRVCRLQGYTVLPYLDVLPQDDWSYAHHNFRKYGLTERSFFPQAVVIQTAVCLCFV